MKSSIPTLEELHPPLVEARRKRNEINVNKSKIEAEIRSLRSEGAHAGGLGSNEISNRVRIILGEIPEPPVDAHSRRLGELLKELDALGRAEAHLFGVIDKEIYAASRLVCEKVSGQHKALGKKFADAVIALHKANADYFAFIDEVESIGASLTPLHAVYPTQWMGHPRDPCGGYHYMLAEFRDAGLIDKSSIPEVVR